MAILKLKNGKIYTDIGEIEKKLSSSKIQLAQIPLDTYLSNPAMSEYLETVLECESLDLSQKQQILQALNPKFTTCQHIRGYSRHDLMVINPTSPHLYDLLDRGSRPHAHSEDEVLYVLAGECIFGFARADGLMELILQAREYVKVPAGLRHWFSLSASLPIKAVRYFTHRTQLPPTYTEWIADN
jgi:1,2-dihydroxy-3-keto-5-methylthiopentene dioxygenase